MCLMNDKNKLFSALDELHEIIAEPIRPTDKEQWKEWVWNRNKDMSNEEFEVLVDTVIGIARYKEDSDGEANTD